MRVSWLTAPGRTVWVAALVLVQASGSWAAASPHRRDGYVVTRDSVRIHYIEAGSGPSIVFVPGWAISAEIWHEQIERLSRRYHVVAIDARSQGRSSLTTHGLYPEVRATDIRAVISGLGLSPVVLVGWSMGASDVAAYVDEYGTGDVAGLVFVDGSPGGDVGPDLAPVLLQFLGQYQRHPRATMDAFVRGLFTTPQPESSIKALLVAALRMPPVVAEAQYLGTITSDHRAVIAKIDRPTLLISGDEEARTMRAVHDQIPGSELEPFPGAGHALFVDQADRFDALLDAFAARAHRRPDSSSKSVRPQD